MRLFSEHSTQVMRCNTLQQMSVRAIGCWLLPFPTSNSSPPAISIKFLPLDTAQNNFGLTQHPVKQTSFTTTCLTAPSVVTLTNYPARLRKRKKRFRAGSNVVLKNNTRWRRQQSGLSKPCGRPEFKAPSRHTDNLPDRRSCQIACAGLSKRLFWQ